jgi:NADP-dependent 3-hydroxy acid dehydrogenase YdfG
LPQKKIAVREHLPLKVVPMDVDDCGSVKEAIKKIFEEEKRIDILINNAGYGLFGALEDLTIEDIKKQFETNFFGAIRTIQQVLLIMRSQRAGCSNTSKRLQNEDDNQLQILYELFSDILEANARFRNCDQL